MSHRETCKKSPCPTCEKLTDDALKEAPTFDSFRWMFRDMPVSGVSVIIRDRKTTEKAVATPPRTLTIKVRKKNA